MGFLLASVSRIVLTLALASFLNLNAIGCGPPTPTTRGFVTGRNRVAHSRGPPFVASHVNHISISIPGNVKPLSQVAHSSTSAGI
ncbi:hypothetical protein F4801DRAFT_544275 [Xylaria longipes]|nr:hypothetical protein F4801DRAFT_544275 [Xylaria longipes]